MFSKQEPEAGRWYVNRTGKLIKAKLVMLEAGQPQRILVEYLDGMRLMIGVDAWRCLQLCEHSPSTAVRL